jgi:ABC-type multidrug transport system ATPase subunit
LIEHAKAIIIFAKIFFFI